MRGMTRRWIVCGALLLGATTAHAQDTVDLHTVTVLAGPGDVADWPETATITGLDFHADADCCLRIDFTKKDGPDRWPDVTPPGWTGPVQYTVWAIFKLRDGRLVTAGAVEFWHGKDRSGGNPSELAAHWFDKVGDMRNHQPDAGEAVGFFLTAGDQRLKDVHAVRERSNVVVIPFPTDSGATYHFESAPTADPTPAVDPTPPATPTPVDLAPFAQRLDTIEARLAAIEETLQHVATKEDIATLRQQVVDAVKQLATLLPFLKFGSGK
jgi:hypothetical protein